MLGAAARRGVGLAVLLQSGVAGWLRAVGSCAPGCPAATTRVSPPVVSPLDPPTTASRGCPSGIAMLSPTAYDEVAKLIASLVLSKHQLQKPCRASAHGGA
jgi:hypothetical protein